MRDVLLGQGASGVATRMPPETVLEPSSWRPDIQALRALAVVSVVLFHFWPSQLAGGYVGVDVFFVISGFLISGHIFRELAATGKIQLVPFWVKRARRLLPAAILVAIATMVGVYLVAPASNWRSWIHEMIGAIVYVENWVLIAKGTDYLAQEEAASPFEHYWSLSVEEQFYILWPLLLIFSGWLMSRFRRKHSIGVMLVGVTVGSFVLSVWLTWTQPGEAYFSTFGRAWEFGVGALVAFFMKYRRVHIRSALAGSAVVIVGWLLIIGAVFAFDSTTPFPGWAATIPVAGAAIAIFGGANHGKGLLSRVLSSRPLQIIGDASYSIYLVHFPVVVLLPFVWDGEDFALGIVSLAITVFTGLLLKSNVEDRFRWHHGRRLRPQFTAVGVVAGIACGVAVGSGGLMWLDSINARTQEQFNEAVGDPNECLGAVSFLTGCDAPGDEVVPSLAIRADDIGNAFDCYAASPSGRISPCTVGAESGEAEISIAVTGDSHAAMLIPGLSVEASRRGWIIDVYVSRGCVWGLAADEGPDCDAYQESLDVALSEGGYDIILVTKWRNPEISEDARESDASSSGQKWEEFAVMHPETTVIGLVDNPTLNDVMADCIANSESDADLRQCNMTEDQAWSVPDIVTAAVGSESGVALIDLSGAYCHNGLCPAVVGDVLVYRDSHHITASFSKTLAPALADAIFGAYESHAQ